MNGYIELAPAKRWLLMGDGPLLLLVATELAARGMPFHVACGMRHLDATLPEDNRTLRQALEDSQLPAWEVEDIHSDQRVLDWLNQPTIGLSIGAPWLLRQDFIERFERRLFNSHGARLPRDRGGGGYSWRILRNDRQGYSVLHELTPGVDKGGIVKLKEYLFPPSCRIPVDYHAYASSQDATILLSLVEDAARGVALQVMSQPEYLSTYWPRLHTLTNGAIDWNWTLLQIERFINAFDRPFPGAFTFINGERCQLRGCQATTDDGIFHPFQAGLVYRKSSLGLLVAVADGSLIVTEVLDSDGNTITEEIRLGDRFHTPPDVLSRALRFRPKYSALGMQSGSTGQLDDKPLLNDGGQS